MEYFILIYPLIYLLTILIAVLYFEKLRSSHLLKLFLIFLIYSLTTELAVFVIGQIFRKVTFYIYNSWNFANSYFYFYFFYKLTVSRFVKNSIKIIALFYTVASIIEIAFFTNFISESMNFNVLVSSVLIVVSVMYYFIELLKSDAVLKIGYSIYFWISIGVLLFNIGMVPIFVIAKLIAYNGVFDIIILMLNILMSLCFITGFIVSKKEYNL